MRCLRWLSLLCLCIVARSSLAQSTDEAQALVTKALQAVGGEEQLTRFKAVQESSKGTIFLNDKEIEFTATSVVQLPNRLRNELHLTIDGRMTTILQDCDGEKGWLKVNTETVPFDEGTLAEAREALYAHRIMELVSLLKDKTFTLTTVPEQMIQGQPAVGVKVSAKGHEDISLYFHKDTKLLLKSERRMTAKRQQVKQEEFYSDYRDGPAGKRAAKIVINRDGKKFLAGTVVEVKGLDKPTDELFGKP